jgi:hypothetical protein
MIIRIRLNRGFGDRTPSLYLYMAHEIAKLMLEHAATFLERSQAIETALSLGMPLNEIEEYLDWLDTTRPPQQDNSKEEKDE